MKRMVAGVLALGAVATFAAPIEQDLGSRRAEVKFLAVGKPSMLKIHGKVDAEHPVQGKVSIDGKRLNVDAQVALDTLDTGISLRNRHMKEKYLHTDKYPKARLVIEGLTLPDTYLPGAKAESMPFEGTFTLHGQTRPVKGKLSLHPEPSRLLDVKFRLSMADFGIETPEFMGIKVTDDVIVEAHVASR